MNSKDSEQLLVYVRNHPSVPCNVTEGSVLPLPSPSVHRVQLLIWWGQGADGGWGGRVLQQEECPTASNSRTHTSDLLWFN